MECQNASQNARLAFWQWRTFDDTQNRRRFEPIVLPACDASLTLHLLSSAQQPLPMGQLLAATSNFLLTPVRTFFVRARFLIEHSE